MADSIKNRKRECLGEAIQDVCEIPNLIGIQLDSYKNFLQLDKIGTPEGPNPNEDWNMYSDRRFRWKAKTEI